MASPWKEAKKQRKADKKSHKKERKLGKKARKLDKKKVKSARKMDKKEAKLQRKMARYGVEPQAEGGEVPEFETVSEVEEIPEFEVVDDGPSRPDIDVGDTPVDKGRLPEIERKMDYLMGGDSGVARKYKEMFGEDIGVPVAPKVEKGAPREFAPADVEETRIDEPEPETAPVEEPVKGKKKKKRKKEKKPSEPGEKVGFFQFTKIFFIKSRLGDPNIIVKIIVSIIDILLWLGLRLGLGILVFIIKKIIGLVKRDKGEEVEETE